jgi:hypothetical protein
MVASERGVPLYTAAARPTVDQVATLGGYVATVDGREVRSLGSVFELLPGCHFVETPKQWGGQNPSGGLVATTGTQMFAVPMLATHNYVVVTDTVTNGPNGSLTIRIDETDVAGLLVRSFPPYATRAEIEACRQWRP